MDRFGAGMSFHGRSKASLPVCPGYQIGFHSTSRSGRSLHFMS